MDVVKFPWVVPGKIYYVLYHHNLLFHLNYFDRVLGQVSCEIQQPKSTRPNEGLLHINVGLSPMGAPHFETGRQSATSIQLNRLLEKCIKDSKCVDLESLCIVAEEKV